MPAFVYERSWGFSFDNAFTPATALEETRYACWALCSMLVGGLGGLTGTGLWTIYTTSDGTPGGTGVTGDGVDHLHLLGAFTAGDWLRAAAGVAHSWAVLKSPVMNGQTFYLLLSLGTASDAQVVTMLSKVAFAGGTNIADPTASDSYNLGQAAQANFDGGNTNLHRFNICLSTTGDFIWFWTRAGQNKAEAAVLVVAPMSCDPLDLYPLWSYRMWNNLATGITGEKLTASTMVARDFKGLSSLAQILATERTAQVITSNDALTGRVQDFPCYVLVSNAGCWHARGRLPDIVYCGEDGAANFPVAGNTVKDGAAVVKSITMGSLVIPANAAPNMT